MKKRDFIKSVLALASFPVIAKIKEPELKPILKDGKPWDSLYNEEPIAAKFEQELSKPVILTGKTNSLFKGGDLQWTQDQINIMRSRQVEMLKINRIKGVA